MSNNNVKTQKKEIELIKTDEVLGLTLCRGEDGNVIISRIAPGSIASKNSHAIRIGDIIETINGDDMIGKTHRQIAAKLQGIPLGTSFNLRLISIVHPAISSGKKY